MSSWIILVILNKIYQTPLLLSIYKVCKYVIHYTTKTSELYRLCNHPYNTQDEKDKEVSKDIVFRIDQSIYYSKQLVDEKVQLKNNNCQVSQVLQSILAKKQFPTTTSEPAQVLNHSLVCIFESNCVLNEIEKNITTKYNVDDEFHEERLLQLWKLMKPDTPLESRITKQWVDIGFQGTDPSTDFRGMGIEGLEDLIYFVERYPTVVQSIQQHASHPVYWYPYAIVGINITKFAYQLLESKQLQRYLFEYGTQTAQFKEFYCYLFYQFNQFWITHEPKLTVMDFESKFTEFKQTVSKDLMRDKIVPLSHYLKSLE